MRDHWPICWSLALGGGGIRTGQVVGKSDEKGAQCIERQVSLGDVFATVYKAMGIQWDKEYITPIGRPIKIANSLKDATGEDLSTRAMVDYFQPLMDWLKEQNKGRKIGWAEANTDKSDEEKEKAKDERGGPGVVYQ